MLCVPGPFPSFASLHALAMPSVSFPPTIDFVMPPFPSLPSPMLPDIKNPNWDRLQAIQELQSFQLMSIMNAVLGTLTGFLGISIGSIIPDIPNLGLNLIDILSMNPQALVDAVKAALLSLGMGAFPGLPNPLFPGISMPSLEAITIGKIIVKKYTMGLVTIVLDLIAQVADILELPSLTLPALPSFPDLLAMIPSFSFPSPLMPNMNIPSIEAMEKLSILLSEQIIAFLSPIVDFIVGTLGLAVALPALCIPF